MLGLFQALCGEDHAKEAIVEATTEATASAHG